MAAVGIRAQWLRLVLARSRLSYLPVGAKPVTPTFHHQFPLFQPSAIGVTPVSPKLVSVSPKVTSNGPKVLPKGPVKFGTVKPTSVSIDMKAGAAPKAKLPPRIFHLVT